MTPRTSTTHLAPQYVFAARLALRCGLVSAFSATVLSSGVALATPGSHAPLVSTWDSTSSSVSGAFTAGFFSGGHIYFGSYNSNFSSTSGNVSAQFGLHYVNYQPTAVAPSLQGASGTAAFVYSAPVLGRWESGLPKFAIGFYLGAAPTMLFAPSVQLNGQPITDGWIPIAAGFALPGAPASFVSLVPWVELAAGPTFGLAITAPPTTTPVATPPTVSSNLAGAVALRGGLKVDFHIGRRVDLGAYLMLANLGGQFDGPFATFVGGNMNVHWDDVVAAVLTPKERLSSETCEDVTERMKECGPPKAGAPQTLQAPGGFLPPPPPMPPGAPPPPPPR